MSDHKLNFASAINQIDIDDDDRSFPSVVPDKPANPPSKGKNKKDDSVSVTTGILSGSMLKFEATEDVSVSNKNTKITETLLSVAKSKRGETRAFIKFDVSGVIDTLVSAKVLLHSNSPSNQGGTISQVSSTDWSEDTMTWKNQPAIDASVLSSVAAVRHQDYYEWDVKPAISGDATYAFALTCERCSAKYDSSEAANYKPYLIIVMADNTSITHVDDHEDYVMVGAGDIASCTSNGDELTALLLDGIEGTVFTAGDNVYINGTDTEFANCYDPTWGKHKERTRPSLGNHGYNTLDASGYFNYFGAAAGDPSKGYYSYNLGSWHILVINSNCSHIGGCFAGSPQEQWVRSELALNTGSCQIAYMHHPRFSSAEHSSQAQMEAIWAALYDGGADIAIAGHDHVYERFAPQDPYGVTDLDSGIRMFVVGTGGVNQYSFYTPIANSEAMSNMSLGVLKLTLHPESYDWEFVPIAGATYTDSGSTLCH